MSEQAKLDDLAERAFSDESDLPGDARVIGVDVLGNTHYHSRSESLVALVDTQTGEVMYSRDDVPAGPAVGRWVDHIAEVRGWVKTEVAELMADTLHHALRDARGGDAE